MSKIVDIADMPNFNPSTKSRGDHSVSEGQVTWTEQNKATCKTHGAMSCVNAERTIWRCEACGAGAYALRSNDENN